MSADVNFFTDAFIWTHDELQNKKEWNMVTIYKYISF